MSSLTFPICTALFCRWTSGTVIWRLVSAPDAIDYYLKALDYQFLNRNIEATSVWLKAAKAVVEEADFHYRRGDVATARDWYERVLRSDDTVPVASRLYQGVYFTPLRTTVGEHHHSDE